jgi:uncharacterized protein (TIGR03437 family)
VTRLLGSLLFLTFSAELAAQAIRTNDGFKRNIVPRNDDGSSFSQSLGFSINFFGRQRSSVYVNNNGNLTFDQPLSEYTPIGITGIRREIIAGFWADVDTRGFGSQVVTYGSDTVNGHRAFGANYIDVGYFIANAEKLNRFQIVLIDRSDTGPGNFDIEYNYERIRWETGDVSGGFFGFGGVSARVGYSNGTGLPGTSFELAGSGIPGSFLDSNPNGLIRRSINSDVPGRLVFEARNGVVQQNLGISIPSISFLAPFNGDAPPPQTVIVTSPGNAVDFTTRVGSGDPWLSVTPTTGRTPATLRIGINTAGLIPGSYVGSIVVTPAPASGVTPLIIPVTLVVALPASECNFQITPGSFIAGPTASTATARISSPAGCLWTATSDSSFVSISSGNIGSGNGVVNFNIAANSGGWRAGSLTIGGLSFAVVQSANIALIQEQICRVTTIAGNGEPGNSGDNGPGLTARLNDPWAVVPTPVNDAIIGDTGNLRIRKWTQDVIIRAFAGNGQPGFGGDGNNALAASFTPAAMVLDSFANLYIADAVNHVIRRVDFLGRVTTIAGTGRAGFSRDGTPVAETQLNGPRGIAIGPGDRIYIADTGNHVIRTIERDGTIKTFAGNGTPGFGGDAGFASNAVFNTPTGLAISPEGDLYIADTGNHRVRVIDAQANVRTIAGAGVSGYSGDGGLAVLARLNTPVSVALDNIGRVYIADRNNNRIRQWDPATKNIVTVGGNGLPLFNGDGVGTQSAFNVPMGVAVDSEQRIWVADSGNHRIRRIACGLGIPPNLELPRITSVSHGAPFTRISIQGENLAAETTGWDGSSPELPSEAGLSKLKIDGKTAYLLSVSPKEIVAMVPDTAVRGTVPLELTTRRGVTIAALEMDDFAPAVFSDRVDGADYLRAALADEPDVALGVERPAKVGDRIVFTATGLGPTDPGATDGAASPDPLPIADLSRLAFTIGEAAVTVEEAAMIAPGLFRVVVTVPEGVTGPLPVTLEVAGRRSQTGVLLVVE